MFSWHVYNVLTDRFQAMDRRLLFYDHDACRLGSYSIAECHLQQLGGKSFSLSPSLPIERPGILTRTDG